MEKKKLKNNKYRAKKTKIVPGVYTINRNKSIFWKIDINAIA